MHVLCNSTSPVAPIEFISCFEFRSNSSCSPGTLWYWSHEQLSYHAFICTLCMYACAHACCKILVRRFSASDLLASSP